MRLARRLILVALVFGIFYFSADLAEAAFGISPPFLNADHLVKGSRYAHTIFLVQDQPNQDLKITTRLEINERVRSWIKVNDGKEIVIPKGVRQFAVPIIVSVPKNADLGVYSGKISFVSVPDEAGQVTIALGVQAAINLTVGDDIYRNFRIAQIRISDIEEGWSPRVFVKFDNQGNIHEQLEASTFEIFDKFGSVKLAYISEARKLPEIAPFSYKEELIEFPLDLHLGMGQYWGSVSFSKGGEVVATQRTIFNVVKAGSLSNPGVILTQHIRLYKNYYILGGLALILGWVVLYKKKKWKIWR